MKKTNKKTKKGAASFYVVAFSTLILMIIATSFAAIIISEVTRTSNDDLAQSAYDSAMAGVEDAKTPVRPAGLPRRSTRRRPRAQSAGLRREDPC